MKDPSAKVWQSPSKALSFNSLPQGMPLVKGPGARGVVPLLYLSLLLLSLYAHSYCYVNTIFLSAFSHNLHFSPLNSIIEIL